jgi:choline dehydrogenase-like flavoprotein
MTLQRDTPAADFDPQDHIWDAVVIGTGAGGATLGYALARRGKSVLFLERGLSDADRLRGIPYAWDQNRQAALRHGWWPDPIQRRVGIHCSPAFHPVGAGVGGGTALYGMVMDRFRPMDFAPRRLFPSTESALPDAWPIAYDELAPYYDEAEALYHVHGSPDPLDPVGNLREAPPPGARESAVAEALRACGLNPYRIHYAQRRVPGCEGCAAMLCPRPCRIDANRACLEPAVQQHGARLLTDCRVTRLDSHHRTIRSATGEWQGRVIRVRGRVFILAANAFMTPALLQRSSNETFPDGIANSSGLVGRNLMLHVSDFLMLELKRERAPTAELTHGLSLNDFYLRDGIKMGNVHMHAVPVTPSTTQSFMRMHMKWTNRLPGAVASLAARVASRIKRRALNFATIVEDLPYPCNHVRAAAGDSDGVEYEYRLPHELRERSWQLFLRFRAQVAPKFSVRPLRPIGMLNLSHVCGTCRFGADPRTSVLDAHNRAHDMDNLYVVDASFLPSSGGINPSLTIAANSLRVGELIAARL